MKSKNKFYTAPELLVFFIIVFFVTFGDVLYSFDNMLRDRLYRTSRGINNKIKIIAIDDKTLDELGTFGTWSRQTYADIINILGEYPAVTAPDIMIFNEMDESGDAALVDACREKGNIVAGSYIDYSPAFVTDENGKTYIDYFHFDSVSEPIIADVCRTGFVNAATDEDGILRSAFMSQSSPVINGGEVFSSFSSVIYSLYCEKTGASEYIPALDGNGRFRVNYAGRLDYEHVSFVDVLNGNVDPRIFIDCIVLIGAMLRECRISIPSREVPLRCTESRSMQKYHTGTYGRQKPRSRQQMVCFACQRGSGSADILYFKTI